MPIRIYEMAKEYKVSSNAMLKILNDLGFQPKSHMSLLTDEMETAVKNKFNAEKQEAKKEMEHRQQVKEAVERTAAAQVHTQTQAHAQPQAQVAGVASTSYGGLRVDNASSPVAGLMRKIEKKQKKKERRKKKDRPTIDQSEVARSFKSTMANLTTIRSKRKYREDEEGADKQSDTPDNVLEVNEFISLADLAHMMDHKPAELIGKLFQMGMVSTINQRLDMDTITLLAQEFGFEVRQMEEAGDFAREVEHTEDMEPRGPVVTIMGHVDHGKTSLLDYIRKTNVVAGEAGAITQHIGAYRVAHKSGWITFLDTPGHEAFTAMRARGTQVTDIVVLVVAADDGVRPQTIEAIDHARAANVPILVAINKIDKPTANPDSIRTQLSGQNLLSEDWGGKVIMVPVSAKTGAGIDTLLEMILLQAETMELKADPTIRASGVVIDSKLERGRGPVATVLIQAGTCIVGDSIVVGVHFGRVRTMTDDRENRLVEAGPSTPVQITGLDGVPQAGDSFIVVESDQEAKEISTTRSQLRREQEARRTFGRASLDKVFDRIKEGQIKEIRLIIKGDVDGSVEVLADTLSKIQHAEVKANIIHSGVGTVTESDVLLAAASDAIIIGFHVNIDARAREVAKQEQVDIRMYSIIYEAESDIKKALEGLLSPTLTDRFSGTAEVRTVFRIPKVGMIAGSYVRDGRITRKDKIRLIRDGKVVYSGILSSLRRFKDDAREVKEGFECGIGIENYNDIKVGDLIEAYETIEEARTL